MPYSDVEKQREWQRDYARRRYAAGQTHAVKARVFVQEYKESHPCTDCGQFFPYYVMDFDHVRGEKIGTISHMHRLSRERLLIEMEKCDLVCANCHRIRTHDRLGVSNSS